MRLIILIAAFCVLSPEPASPRAPAPSERSAAAESPDRVVERVRAALRKRGFDKVEVSRSDGRIVISGSVPKGRMAEAVQTAQEAAGIPVVIKLIEI